jgi:hypothetical protein
MTTYITTRTRILVVNEAHTIHDCSPRHCIIHSPEYPTEDRDLVWRVDRGFFEDICEHGVGHPAPEEIEYWADKYGNAAWAQEVHGCDGCCRDGNGRRIAPDSVL